MTFLFSFYVEKFFKCKTLIIKQFLYFDDSNFLCLYENFYYMVFTLYSAGKIWSSICIQDIALRYQINPVRLI